MIISPVLRKSAEFDERHVYWLRDQCAKFYPEATFWPFSDTPLAMPYTPLLSDLPKWWAKMEIATHPTDEPTLVLDLDVVLLRRVEIPQDRAYVMRHFTRHDALACGMMLWTPDFRTRLARHFFDDPRRHMVDANNDDQRYYKKYFSGEMGRFQDTMPDAIVSYKMTVQPWGLRPANAFVFFHGEPRPWDVDAPWIPELQPAP